MAPPEGALRAFDADERRRRLLPLMGMLPDGTLRAIIETTPETSGRRKSEGERVLELADLFGAAPDVLLAEIAGVHQRIVATWRHMIGIEPYRSRQATGKPRKKAQKLHKYSKSKLARFHDLMGTMPDAKLAHRAHATTEGVKAYRLRHLIPACLPASAASKGRPTSPRVPLDTYHAIIGVLRDAKVAKAAKVSREAVRLYRLRHGIAEGMLSMEPRVAGG